MKAEKPGVARGDLTLITSVFGDIFDCQFIDSASYIILHPPILDYIIIMMGRPGAGKTMLAKRLPIISNPFTSETYTHLSGT